MPTPHSIYTARIEKYGNLAKEYKIKVRNSNIARGIAFLVGIAGAEPGPTASEKRNGRGTQHTGSYRTNTGNHGYKTAERNLKSKLAVYCRPGGSKQRIRNTKTYKSYVNRYQ